MARHGHVGQIIVRDVPETRLRTGFPDCEIVPVGGDLQITVQLRDLADMYPFLEGIRLTGASLVSLSVTELGWPLRDPDMGCFIPVIPGALDRMGADDCK